MTKIQSEICDFNADHSKNTDFVRHYKVAADAHVDKLSY
jgi:hypothetical protein